MYINYENMKRFYSELPPILNAYKDEEIAKMMEKCLDKNFRKTIEKRSISWIKKYHNWKKIKDRYIELYESIHN